MNQENIFLMAEANGKRFFWQTAESYVGEREKELLFFSTENKAVLEIGCGEGANLYHIACSGKANFTAGIDISFNKISFAQKHVENVHFLCADAHAEIGRAHV